MPTWLDPSILAAALSFLVGLFVIIQAGMLLPYRVGALERDVAAVKAELKDEVQAYAAIRQDLAILRRDIEWMVRILAKESGVDVPPFAAPTEQDPSHG